MSAGSVLITGGAGQLGSDLEAVLADREVHRLDRAALDITDDEQVERALERTRPQVVFNCAAFHNVGLCEREEDTAAAVNVRAVKRLAERCATKGAKLVHFSTNYVFDGDAAQPYSEEDRPNPRSAYAITKLAGEHAALAYAPGSLVVRTAGLYGVAGSASKGGNFVERVLGRARAGETIGMVDDQRLAPTFTADLAAAVSAAVDAGAAGLMHLTNGGACSWYEFTLAALEEAGLDATVSPAPTEHRPGEPQRPLNGVLAMGAADSLGLEPLRPWRDALTDYMERAGLAAGAASPRS